MAADWKLLNRGIDHNSIPRLAPYLGELARDERHQFARADGIRWLEVVGEGVAICTFGAVTFINCGSTNRTGLGNRSSRLYDFSTLIKQRAYRTGKPLILLARPERFELPTAWFVASIATISN